MAHIIAITNQKGGVGKTTSAINLSAELATAGRRVLLIDLDPQGNATSGVGVPFIQDGPRAYDMFFGRVSLERLIQDTKINNLKVMPSCRELVAVESELGRAPGRELILKTQIRLLTTLFDCIIIDCPPSSGLLTINALCASNNVLIPLQAEYYALEGVSSILNTINFVQQTFNPELSILGVFMTMFDGRTRLAVDVEKEAKTFFKEGMFKSVIPRSVRLSEAPSHGLPVCIYDATCSGAKAYRMLAKEIDARLFGALELQRVVGE